VNRWTDPQQQAIDARGGHVLCAAAAGAGKTAVLTERVVSRLADPQDPLDVDQLLVVTFTRSAAAEMRRRIAGRLRERAPESARLQRQLWLLPQADIATIHGFCERTLRRHFAVAGLDPRFAMLDAEEGRLLRRECLENLLEARYRGDGGLEAAFADMVARYGGRRLDEGLRPLVLRLHDFALSLEDPSGWIRDQGEAARRTDFPTARQAALRTLRQAAARTRRAATLAERPDGPYAYADALEADADLLVGLSAAADGPWDAFAAALRGASFARLKQMNDDASRLIADRVKALRAKTKDEIAALAAGPFGRPAADHEAETAAVADHLQPLLHLVADLESAFTAAKRRLNALDFDDLEHRTLEVLRGPQGPAATARYREVLVDESQDLSPVQDGLLSALCAQAALFCVGDARQSIYGFRQAEPRRFLERAAAYADGGRGRRIGLPHNFRSRRGVIAGINLLFDRLFLARGSGLPLGEAGPLLYGADYGEDDPPLELHLLEGDLEQAEAPVIQREAAAVADLVVGWLGGATVGSGSAARPAQPGDVAILLRAMRGVDAYYLEALRARGVAAWAPAGGGRAATPEGRTVLAWLSVLDNPQQDIPLAATLRGKFGGFDDTDLAEMRAAAPGGNLWRALRACGRRGPAGLRARAAAALVRLDAWRTAARRGGFGGLVGAALQETGYLAYVGGLPGGAERRRNLAWVHERCRAADRFAAMDLPRLIDFLERGESGETVAEAAAQAGDAVRIMSVHASKGLEFPLVVVAGLGRRFQFRDRQGDVLAHREAGLGAKAVDLDRRLRWPTLRHAAVAERLEADARAEELRVCYVALTRARERLALVGTVRGLAERAAEWCAVAGLDLDLGDGACPLDWIGPVLAAHPDVAAPLAALADRPGGGDGDGDDAPPPAEALRAGGTAPGDGGGAAAGAPGTRAQGGCRWVLTLHQGEGSNPATAAAEGAGPGARAETSPSRDTAGAAAGRVEQAADAADREGDAAGATVPALRQQAADATLARLDAEAAWRYPWAAVAGLSAKVTVGELRDAGFGEEEPGGTLEEVERARGGGRRRSTADGGALLARPRLHPGPPSPAEVGTATHLVLRHLDPAAGSDDAAVRRAVFDLLAREALEPAAGAAVDLAAIAAFLGGTLGQRLRAAHAAGALRREVPFALRLAATEVYGPAAPADSAAQEWVLVQGVFDALLIEPHGLTLIDYKTDRVRGDAALEAAVARYRAQLALYARAAASAWQRPVREAWLAFLGPGREIRVPIGDREGGA